MGRPRGCSCGRFVGGAREGEPKGDGDEGEEDEGADGAGGWVCDLERFEEADADAADEGQEVEQECEGSEEAVAPDDDPGDEGEEELLEAPLGEDGDDVVTAGDIDVDAAMELAPPSGTNMWTRLRVVVTMLATMRNQKAAAAPR